MARVGTNLTIVTSRHTYQVDYSASAQRPDATQDVIYALRFTYPPDPQKESESATEKELETHRAEELRLLVLRQSRHPARRGLPDDGVHTRIRFAANSEQPAIFVRNEDGTESLLNFSMDDGDVTPPPRGSSTHFAARET